MFWCSSDDINVFMEAAVGFIRKLTVDTVQKKTVKTFPNQKPWVDKNIRDALRSRTTAYNTRLNVRNVDEYKASSYNVRRAVKNAIMEDTFIIFEHDLRMAFRRVNNRKAAGPDSITG